MAASISVCFTLFSWFAGTAITRVPTLFARKCSAITAASVSDVCPPISTRPSSARLRQVAATLETPASCRSQCFVSGVRPSISKPPWFTYTESPALSTSR
eukprot:Gregarina_sp_Pseudo_9__429@NODE_1279_length_1717_cov_36_058999_g1202_i0_p7_GENE_NODE_1279_length_1717_cov_36_058999_g1202_i0NODE_1279_length_1717_cov_36_058999_g1202_i0_p7_ORF_typecomplete_len100_score14_89_NODE_1279_length_1717_cov_36_058999_g1202_i013641663